MLQNKKGLLGVLAILLLGLLFLAARQLESQTGSQHDTLGEDATITVADESLTYDGSGLINYLDGVTASDDDVTDLSDQMNYIIVSDGNQKYVQYSVSGQNGQVVYARRPLVLENYQGPSLEVSDPLRFDAEALNQLVPYLAEQGDLKALDGFGQDQTSSVSYRRTKEGTGRYLIQFTYTNAFQDSVSQTVNAYISGEVSDPSIELVQNSVVLSVGSSFVPTDFILSANDGTQSAVDRVQISNYVNTAVPGKYRVVYELTSADGTAYTSCALEVEVQG